MASLDRIAWMQRFLEFKRDPRLHDVGLELLPPGPGRRNYLFAATSAHRSYVIKVRRDAEDSAEREAWALRKLKGTIAPRLICWWPGEGTTDESSRPAGGCVVMTRVPGEVPSAAQSKLAGRIIAELHMHSPRRGPEILCPSSPGALLRYAADLAERVLRRRKLSRSQMDGLNRAMRRLGRREAPDFPSVRTLCHGDLRWHNMRWVGDELRLLDFELAGIGDPAVDLALMVARTPLSEREAKGLLSTYLRHRKDETLRARYEFVLPLVSLVSALSAVLISAKESSGELDRALNRARLRG